MHVFFVRLGTLGLSPVSCCCEQITVVQNAFSENIPVSVLSMKAAALTKWLLAYVHTIANGLPDKAVITQYLRLFNLILFSIVC